MADETPNIYDIFNEAAERDSEAARLEYLDEACQGDLQVRGRVEALLRAHSDPQNDLDRASPAIALTTDHPPAEQIDTYIGPYKLREEIGEGGMGSVYMATQKEPIRRKVALKVIKAGMDSKQVVSRFEAERQALAMMDHPNIARVIDGGTTDSGRPYFVMELVKGISITGYCDRYRITTAERLELFGNVCSAVHHAHQKGVIHRDLKPSNIMVTLLDGRAIPKVIDFGIAKATSGHLAGESLVTGLSQMVGTPAYMSPEQTDISAADVDTRSDVYSLGVLLYELLTGTTPFDRERLKEASYDELRRIIQEEEPPRPSTRLSTLNAALDTVADKHQTDPRTLSNRVSGELDWIVMKSLEKDRTRRYQSVNELAKDVQRYLDDEAVEACPPTAAYRLKKFARRNRTLLSTAALVGLILIAATSFSAWQAIEANGARRLAEERQTLADQRLAGEQRAKRRAEIRTAISMQLIDSMYEDIDWLDNTPGLGEVRQAYIERALQFLEQLDEEGHATVATVHAAKMARYLANLYSACGEHGRASQHIEMSIERLEAQVEAHPLAPETQLSLANSYLSSGAIELAQQRFDEAASEAQHAIAICERLLEASPFDEDVLVALSSGEDIYLVATEKTGDFKNSEDVRVHILERQELLTDLHPTSATYWANLGAARHNLARLYTRHGNGDKAASLLRKAVDASQQALELEPQKKATRAFLGNHYTQLGILSLDVLNTPAEAEQWFLKAIDCRTQLAADYPREPMYRRALANSYNSLANALVRMKNLSEGYAAYERAIGICIELVRDYPDDPRYLRTLATTQANLGHRLRDGKELERAVQVLGEAEESLRELAEAKRPQELALLAIVLQWRSFAEQELGLLDKAVQTQSEVVSIRRQLVEQAPGNIAYTSSLGGDLHNLAMFLVGQDDYGQAVTCLEEAITLQQQAHQARPEHSGYRLFLRNHFGFLATCLSNAADASLRDLPRAIESARQAIALDPDYAAGWQSLGIAQYRGGDWTTAIESLTKSNDLESGGDAMQWYFLAMSHYQLDHKAEARQWLDRADKWMADEKPDKPRLQRARDEATDLLGSSQRSDDTQQRKHEGKSIEEGSSELKQ